MKYCHIKKILFIFILMFLFSNNLFAGKKDFFLKPQLGLWFGPITPIYTTGENVDTFALGVGGYFRYNMPIDSLKFGLDVSYQYYGSEGVNELELVPVIGNLIYLIPFDLPVRFQVKGGAGMSWVQIMPDDSSQWDPVFMAGVEMSFPAGRVVNIGLRIDYLYVYEGYIEGSSRGGHVINSGITLYFNVN